MSRARRARPRRTASPAGSPSTSGAAPSPLPWCRCRSTIGRPDRPTAFIPHEERATMTVPEELQYTPEHEWVAITGSTASVGITDHAQNALGDVVYVSVPTPGSKGTAGHPCAERESTESVSDLYSAVDR